MKRTTLFAVACMAIAPAGLQAQATVADDSAIRTERAEILTEQAFLVANQAADFSSAALYLREAAELFGTDHASVAALVNAGKYHYYANRKLSAVSALRAAAETAERIGDLATASQAFRDAAWVAAQVGEVPTARELLERSQNLLATVAVVALGQAADN